MLQSLASGLRQLVGSPTATSSSSRCTPKANPSNIGSSVHEENELQETPVAKRLRSSPSTAETAKNAISPAKHAWTFRPPLRKYILPSASTTEETDTTAESDSERFTSEQVSSIRSLLMGRIAEQLPPTRLVNLDEQFETLSTLIENGVLQKESNSVVVLGARGTGKSMLLRKCLERVREKCDPVTEIPFYYVYLNGLAHTTDRAALLEIIRGLSLEKDIDISSFGSFSECFIQVFETLKEASRASIPIVIVLDEFDLFLDHHKQVLLYNLFDTVQSCANSLTVVGLSCRPDAVEKLEKRVKSRFSHRQIYTFPMTSLEAYMDILRQALTIDEQDSLPLPPAKRDRFNQRLEELFVHPEFTKIVKRQFELEAYIRNVFRILMHPIQKLSAEQPFLTADAIQESAINQRMDSKTLILRGLSDLEICLVIAMKRLVEMDTMQFNFEMVFDVYNEFATIHGISFKRAVALKAFEHLVSLELVSIVESISKCPKQFRMVRLLLEPSQIAEAVIRKDVPYYMKRWGTERA